MVRFVNRVNSATLFFVLLLAHASARQPNLIYINTDDWGIGKVPCYKLDDASMKIIRTPNLDRLRAEGMLFRNAYAGNAVCGPSRCSLLTGKHGGHAVWRANSKNPPSPEWPPKAPMLGEVARQAGYTTAGFGKLSPGGTSSPEEITDTGWDYWMGYLGHIDCRSFYNHYVWVDGKEVAIPENDPEKLKEHVPVLGEHGVFTEDLYADKAIEFIQKNRGKPFFIYYASAVPHGDSSKIPYNGLWVPDMEGYDKLELTDKERLYAALMTRHDRNVGRLMDTLRKLGIAENTIIMWTSDNGDEDSYYERTDTWDGNGPYRMYKRYLYEGGIRVPLIAWWPGTIKAGSECDLRTTQYDLMPTLADMGSKPSTDDMDGISIYPTLKGDMGAQTKREYLYWEFYERGPQQAVHLGKWKGYRAAKGKWKLELYDLENDEGEENDLAASHPEVVARIEKIMKEEHTESPNPRWKISCLGEKAKGRKK